MCFHKHSSCKHTGGCVWALSVRLLYETRVPHENHWRERQEEHLTLLHVFLVVYLIAGTFLWQLHGLATFPFIHKMEPILVTPSGAIGTTELASPEGQFAVPDGRQCLAPRRWPVSHCGRRGTFCVQALPPSPLCSGTTLAASPPLSLHCPT